MTDQHKKITKQNNILWIILAIAIVLFGGYSMLTGTPDPIEDINGPDDYSLAVITDENIIKQDIGARNVTVVSNTFNLLNDGVTIKSNNFSGVHRLFLTDFIFKSDFEMDVAGFQVNSGNFRMCIINNDQIIADVEPDMLVNVRLDDLKGTTELVIAGESADFEFTLDRMFCEDYGIVDKK